MKSSKVKFFRINKLGETIAVLEDGASMNARNSKHLSIGDTVNYTPVKEGDKYTDAQGVEQTNANAFNRFEGFIPVMQAMKLKIVELQVAQLL